MTTDPENPQKPTSGPVPPPPGAVPAPPHGDHGPGSSRGAAGAYPGGAAPGGYPPPGYGPAGYAQPGPHGGYPPPATMVGAPLSPSDQRLWSVLSHLLTLFVGFIAPLVIWLALRGRGAFSEDHSKESLNFQITMTLAAIVMLVGTVVTLGLGALVFVPLLGILVVVVLVFVIVAAVQAGQGQPYRYPLTYRFIK